MGLPEQARRMFSREMSVMTFADTFTSASIALFVGAISGGLLGWFHGPFILGESYLELASVCGFFSAILGAFGGSIAGTVARISGRLLIGICIAVILSFPLALLAHPVAYVWLGAMLTGSIGCLCMNRCGWKQRRPTESSADTCR